MYLTLVAWPDKQAVAVRAAAAITAGIQMLLRERRDILESVLAMYIRVFAIPTKIVVGTGETSPSHSLDWVSAASIAAGPILRYFAIVQIELAEIRHW